MKYFCNLRLHTLVPICPLRWPGCGDTAGRWYSRLGLQHSQHRGSISYISDSLPFQSENNLGCNRVLTSGDAFFNYHIKFCSSVWPLAINVSMSWLWLCYLYIQIAEIQLSNPILCHFIMSMIYSELYSTFYKLYLGFKS